MIEASYDSRRKNWFSNFCADCIMIYYLVMAGGIRKANKKEACTLMLSHIFDRIFSSNIHFLGRKFRGKKIMSDRLQTLLERAGREAETLRTQANRHEANGNPILANLYRNEAWTIEHGGGVQIQKYGSHQNDLLTWL